MRLGLTILLLAGFGAPGVAQAPPGFEWSSDRKLTVPDFQGQPPLRTRFGSLSFIRLQANWRCEDGRWTGVSRAMFDPSRSWWLGPASDNWSKIDSREAWQAASRYDLEDRRVMQEATRELLHHEQVHFDLAEIAARRIRQRFMQAPDGCAETGVTQELRSFVDQVNREFRAEQRRYDRETQHGTYLAGQAEWARKAREGLKNIAP